MVRSARCKILSLLMSISKNFKLEFFILLITAILSILSFFEISIISPTIKAVYSFGQKYLTSEMISGIETFFSITIAIYVAVISIFSTTVLGITKELLRRSLDKDLLHVLIFGIGINLMTVLILIFLPNFLPFYYLLVFGLLIASVISLIKFLIIITQIFTLNMNEIATQIDSEERQRQTLSQVLEDIERNTRKP